MNWLAAIGVVSLGVAIYELFTRPSARELANNAAATVRADAAAAAAQVKVLGAVNMPNPRAADPVKVASCGLEVGDWQKADAWSRGIVGAQLDLIPRLVLIRSFQPVLTWPTSAQRVYCVYVGG